MLAYAKAIVAFIVGALAPLISASVASGGPLTSTDFITAVVTALLSAGAVLGVKNKGAVSASGIIVTLRTDADKFLSVLLTGLPAVVEPPTQAALSPSAPVTPVPAPVAAVAADTLAPPSAG